MHEAAARPPPLQSAAPDTAAPASSAASMMPPMTPRARRQGIRNAFERAAAHYDEAALIQREICSRLRAFAVGLDLQAGVSIDDTVLDAGCGTGFGFAELDQLCPGTTRIALDLAPSMLAQAGRRHERARARTNRAQSATAAACAESARAHDAGGSSGLLAVCGDLEHLPLASGRIALIWSSLAIQWCEPGRALAECARVLAPGGVALVATLGPRTLWELREAFALIDGARHTIDFHSATAWVRAAQAAALTPIAHETLELHASAPDLRGLLQDIKRIGAATVDGGRRRQPLGRAAWTRLQDGYERYRRSDGRLPATYEVILLALRKPAPSPPSR
jgi:malonyl-CoA O-methyltransferase